MIEGFSEVSLDNTAVPADILGDAYEYLVGKFADVTRRNKAVRVTPAKRCRGRKRRQPGEENSLDKTPAERHASITWMQRLKRVFN